MHCGVRMSGELPPSVRVFAAGDSGSGKSTRLWTMYLRHFPRVVVLDTLGEWDQFELPDRRLVKADCIVQGVPELVAEVQRRAPSGKFLISAWLDGDSDFEQLCDWLVPLGDKFASPVLRMGGAALVVDECDVYARIGGPPPQHIRTLYRRSRHVGLSVLSATQRPGNVNKEVTGQSTHLVAHRLHEPKDRDYIANFMRWTRQDVEAWQDWTRRHPHGAVWKELASGRTLCPPERGEPLPFPSQDLRRRSGQSPAPVAADDGGGDAAPSPPESPPHATPEQVEP